jgi:hypothetical protein
MRSCAEMMVATYQGCGTGVRSVRHGVSEHVGGQDGCHVAGGAVPARPTPADVVIPHLQAGTSTTGKEKADETSTTVETVNMCSM